MNKTKSHGAEFKKEMDILVSRISALEASATEREKKTLFEALLILAENQKHFADEFEHIKKAIDLLTLQLFKMDQARK